MINNGKQKSFESERIKRGKVDNAYLDVRLASFRGHLKGTKNWVHISNRLTSLKREKRKEYELGYEEGYEAGFDDGFVDSDYDSEDEE